VAKTGLLAPFVDVEVAVLPAKREHSRKGFCRQRVVRIRQRVKANEIFAAVGSTYGRVGRDRDRRHGRHIDVCRKRLEKCLFIRVAGIDANVSKAKLCEGGAKPLSCYLTVAFWPAVNVVAPVGLVVMKAFASAEATRASGTIAAVNIFGENE